MKLPQSLLDAKAAVEMCLQRQAAIEKSRGQLAVAGEQAAARISEVNSEVAKLRGVILEDDALSGVAGEECLNPEVRAATERRLAALIVERDGLAAQVEQSASGAVALARVAAERAQDAVEPISAFLREWRAFTAAVWLEFHRDASSLTLPQYIKKWACVGYGLGYGGIIGKLNEIRVIGISPIIVGGLHYDPADGKPSDLRQAWRSDAALVELNRSLAEIAAFEHRMSRRVKAADDNRREMEEWQRLENQRVWLASGGQTSPVVTYRGPPEPPDVPYRPGRSWVAPPDSLPS